MSEKAEIRRDVERAEAASGPPEGLSFARIAYRQLVRNRLAMFGFALVVLVTTVAVLVPFLANDKPYVILTTLPDEYDEAYFSWKDAHEQLAGLLARGERSGEVFNRNKQVLFTNLRRMASQLVEEKRRALRECSVRYARLLDQREFSPAEWKNLSDVIQSGFAIEKVRLVPHYYFPLFRSLRSIEIFFLVLYFAAILQWVFRRRWRPTWRKASVALVVAATISAMWPLAFPRRVIPDGYYKELLPNASFALFPPVPYGETESILEDMKQPPTWLIPREKRGANYHVLGTDSIGRDVLSRMIYGSRIAMIIGFVAVGIYVTIGVIVGAVAGFFRGRVDMLVSRVIEVVICFPTLFLILIVLAYMRPSIINIMVVIGLTGWTGVARLTRGEFLRIVNMEYVSAVQALGGSSVRIIFRHILPNGIGPVLVVASFGIAAAILVESALSFLGLGVPQPFASWGTLLNDGRADIQGAWWLTVFPGFAIFLTVTAWNLFGEGLRDAIDPRLKQ